MLFLFNSQICSLNPVADFKYIYIYIYIYVCVCVILYIYIYIIKKIRYKIKRTYLGIKKQHIYSIDVFYSS